MVGYATRIASDILQEDVFPQFLYDVRARSTGTVQHHFWADHFLG
jgi:hypothetical protein